MPLPKLNDTASWDWLVKTSRWPKEKPSVYVRHYLAMKRLRRYSEEVSLLAIVTSSILATSLRHLHDRGVYANPRDIAETVTNELLHALLKPKSSGRQGLRKFFWTTVRRKTETVASRAIFKMHQLIQLDTTQAQDQPDMDAVAVIESSLIAEQARQILTGAKGKGFDEALRSESKYPELTSSERYALARRETAAKRALQEILEVAARKPGNRKKPISKLPHVESLENPPSTPPEYLRRIAAAILLEDGEGELPPNWEQQALRFLEAADRMRVFQKYIHLYQPEPPVAEQVEFDDFDAMHISGGYNLFNDFYEWYEEEEEFDDTDETLSAA